jgi:hypothetical protein
MFTQRHFEAVARILREEAERLDRLMTKNEERIGNLPTREAERAATLYQEALTGGLVTLSELRNRFGRLFAESNPRFDRQRFIDAATAVEREEAGS